MFCMAVIRNLLHLILNIIVINPSKNSKIILFLTLAATCSVEILLYNELCLENLSLIV